MRILDRYIFYQVLISWISMSVGLIMLAWLIRFLNAMNLVTSAGQSVVAVLKITLLVIPEIAFVVIPITLFLAVLLTIRKLNADSELSVMVAAGISPFRLARPFFIILGIGAMLIGSMSLWIQPYTLALWRAEVTHAGADLITTILQPGQFSKLGGRILFHFRSRDEDGRLNGIIVRDSRDSQKTMMYLAEKGSLLRGGDKTVLVLENGVIQEKLHTTGVQKSVISFARYAVDFSEFSNQNGEVRYKIREYSNPELREGIANPETPEKRARLLAEIHMRLSAPLFTICFGMIALGFLLGAQSTRESKWGPLIFAIVSTLVIRVLSLNFISNANKDSGVILLIYLCALIPIILSFLQITGIVNFSVVIRPVMNRISKLLLIFFIPLLRRLAAIKKKLTFGKQGKNTHSDADANATVGSGVHQ